MLPKQALTRLQRMCSRGEKCTNDLRKKLQEWKISNENAEKIIQQLQEDKFVDDARYARAFVHDKFELAGWGPLKIRNAMALKKIDSSVIDNVLRDIDSLAEKQKLEHLLTWKNKVLKNDLREKRTIKLLRFAAGRGYDYRVAYELVMKIVNN